MNRLKIYLTLFFIVIYGFSSSQEEGNVKKLRFALDIGLDIPNNKYSHFLDGSHPFGVTRFLNNVEIRQRIETELGYPIKSWEFSQLNNYQPAIFAGLYVAFDLKPNWALIMKVNFSSVRFSTPFVLALDNPQNFTGEFEQGSITASEQRFLYAIGVEKRIELETPKIIPYFAAGGSFNYIQLKSHEMIIRSAKYNIMRINNPQTFAIQKIDGFGLGLFLEAGVSFYLNEKFSLAFGGNFNLQQNKEYVEQLTDDTAYLKASAEKAKKLLPSGNGYLRIIWN